MAAARTLLFVAFGLAALSLTVLVVFVLRQPREKRTTLLREPLFLVPISVLIGTLPGVLDVTSEALKIAASIASMIVSVAAVILLIRARLKQNV